MESIVTRFEHVTVRYGNSLALATKKERLTYNDLNALANQVANIILARTAPTNDPVALFVEQSSAEMVIAALGIWKARKALVAVNSTKKTLEWGQRSYLSNAHISQFMKTLKPQLILADNANAAFADSFGKRVVNINLRMTAPKSNPSIEILPSDIALILHTSGTAGEPKAVVRTHEFESYNMAISNDPPTLPGDKTTLFRSSSTAAISDILFGLLNGATLCIFDLNEKKNLSQWVRHEQITVFRSLATVFRMLDYERIECVRLINIGGEPVYQTDVDRYRWQFDYNCKFVVRYAASEAGNISRFVIDNTNWSLPPPSLMLPVGSALGDRRIVILGDLHNELAPNLVGQIAIQSHYLAEGYWQQPTLTAEKFSRLDGAQRQYLTGDRGYIDRGQLVYLGRMKEEFQGK